MAKVCIAVLIPLVLASLAQGHICPEGVCDVQADQTISLLQHDIVAEHGARVRAQLTPKEGENDEEGGNEEGGENDEEGENDEGGESDAEGENEDGGENGAPYVKAAGAATCPASTMVRTAAGCKLAGQAVGHPFRKSVTAGASYGNGAGRPGGCFWDQNGASYFNTNLASSATWGGTGGICKKVGYAKRHCRAPAPEGNSVGDWGNHMGVTKTLEQCKGECDRVPKCLSFVYSAAGGKCHLKDKCITEGSRCQSGSSWNFQTYYKTNCGGGKAVTYKVSGYGSKNCPSGSQPITDLGTCQAAQKALGKRWAGTHSWSNIQSGCFSHANNHVWYNKHPNGRPHRAFSRVCKAQCKPRYNGGCKEHFSFRFNQYKGVTVEECRKKCSDFGCKSFSHGRAGVSRENWCNVYNGICTDNGDKDWDMYVATDCAEAVTPYKVSGYGSKNCPSGSQPITDLGTCQAAQKALGKRWAGTHSWSNIQSGCFSHANNHVWYNKHPNGRPHSAFSRVCKASASNGGSYVKLGNGRCNHAKGYPSHYGFGVGVQKCRGLCDAHSWCIGYDTRNNHMCALYPKKGAPQSPAAAGLRADPGKKWGGLYHDQGFGELVKVAPPLTGECFKKTATSQGGAYTCTEKANFITGIRYSQRSLTDGCRGRVCNANPIYGSPNSIGRAVGWCKAHCGKQAGCTGFFFQRHGNGHEICGFYNSNMHAAGARWGRHGHQAGSQVCEKRAPSALLESQEQAHETVDTQDDGVFEQPLEDDMDMADDSSDENDMENADDSSHENDMDADDSLNEDPASFVQKLIDEDEEGEENEEDPASFVQKLIDEDEEAP